MALTAAFARRLGSVAALALGLVVSAVTPAQAQNSGDRLSSLLLFGVHYGAPERLSGSISGVFPFGTPKREGGGLTTNALEVRARVGLGGYGFAVGHRLLHYGPFGPEAMLTVTRTFSSPRRATGQATYVGVEVGYQLMARVSIGVARQVDGPSHRRDTRLTWSAGLQLPNGFWRW